ncbi:helix-turn-helix transcriptional regulator [Youxingia wuxianensis]|uniref:Transcriptional regulator n=1 Tax=Youxingia wuxianensis TaxID=2763678 RepID=A0A926IC28_9FIRM|nr:helix-turn-helix transcriptional regulator [Youxingia wuxianensis]MBC8584757.1 transcriptional regulator [Youxingia wuxianensis]
MDNIVFTKDEFEKLLTLLELQFGKNCEIVLHDLTKPYDHTIEDIRNGHITGRNIGDCGSNLGLEVIRGTVKNGDKFNYITHTKDGKILRSSSIYFHNKEGNAIASLCINSDITETVKFEKYLNDMNQYSWGENDQAAHEVFASNVNELLEHFIEEAQLEVGKAFEDMNRADKMAVVNILDKKGAFLITKSSEKVCEVLGISKFTLYNYLDILRKSDTSANSGTENA